MDDYISRADAIQALVGITAYNSVEEIQAACFDSYARANGWLGGVMESITALAEGIPAADVRPVVRGKWKVDFADNGWIDHTCSVCGWAKNTDIHVRLGYNFCPNCGADMRPRKENDDV